MGEPRNITDEQRHTIAFSESINDTYAIVKGIRPERSRDEIADKLVETRPWLAKVNFGTRDPGGPPHDMVLVRAAVEGLIEALRGGEPGADEIDPVKDCARRLIISLGVHEDRLPSE